jgi:hypothetical protein
LPSYTVGSIQLAFLESDTAGFLDVDTAGFLELDTAEFLESDTAGFLESDTAGFLESDTAGFLESDTAGFLESDTAGYLELDTAGYLELDTAGFLESDTAGRLRQSRRCSVAARPSPQNPVTFEDLSDLRVSDLSTVNCTALSATNHITADSLLSDCRSGRRTEGFASEFHSNI